MQQMSVERTFCILLYVYGRGRRRCGGPTILTIRRCAFPLVGNAHRAFRGKKHGRMPFGRSTVKHYIIEKFTRIFISANAASVRRRAFRYHHAYILAVGAGAPTLQFYRFQAVGCCAFSSCRWKTWANAVRSVDGKTLYYRKNYTINCFNQCNKCPSNARFVIFFTSTVADAAGAAALQFYRSGFGLQVENAGKCRSVGRRGNIKITVLDHTSGRFIFNNCIKTEAAVFGASFVGTTSLFFNRISSEWR